MAGIRAVQALLFLWFGTRIITVRQIRRLASIMLQRGGRSVVRPRPLKGGTAILLVVTRLLLVVTFHLVLEVFARQLLLSGIVFPLTSVPAKLSQHSAVI